ncbi:2-hydroxyhepta-2,4-diene-1,7-dioate isomerase [Methylorubrum extorquens]|jgi:2,4-diketo-3-deoxy-L-fuconate hydrolase|uniref:2-hydroxyhepta-2,4-diene-1, 7-dioate isomerase/5-carboxymethyl-2-oxo-hex-3-ene-1, 7-dioate decarboxylase n=2 Tax=Methylorubrum extorquens TaxID=408 RepID=C5B2Z9_METEA|nr:MULTISPECIES: fumarylacetoacetate hydrolase family protein [Methylorubrum]ACS42029.1 2-hydroxyhepta-2,4-diene-1, 7-dioate isomerase/5-carboxymethyl-2-oxo- hex-3-ene-1, 7-dioate decarboxylase [Methylorubrum extorquens AM1]APX85454.1 2-hydroxyhepta-2,4-diene-1,7-dioate isomerase [Methylorubrum extorquens]EHP94130.1 Ureidoglycolate lyase [Methylorubrum extorquens DSM 13060]MCP1544924.1 2-keto-4-pentenoate hydratase/2-oxohepta-3-ene-1,7-dioic acid hydratase in catechol pathway [Methylorubrum ext
MKLIRHGASGDEKPGLVDAKGGLRDLSGTLRDLAGPGLSRESLDRLARIDPETLPLLPPGTRLGPCVGGTRNFVAIGLNYADHAAETGAAIPAEPIIFNKAPSCIVGPNDTVILPKASAKTDWEVELAVVIGARASYVHANEALRYVAGVCICNDLSEREFQMERGGTWTKGKGCPTFGPLGPWLVTLDEIPDLKNLSMSLDLNGRRMQTGSTATMIFDVAQIVAYVSHFMMLEPGDVITTGTPPGVGLGMKPPRYLRSDDEMVLRIDGLGEQRQRVVAFDDWTAKVAAGEPTN